MSTPGEHQTEALRAAVRDAELTVHHGIAAEGREGARTYEIGVTIMGLPENPRGLVPDEELQSFVVGLLADRLRTEVVVQDSNQPETTNGQ